MFNCNELPKDVEQSNAFFRRFLILAFNITIPESDQDKELAQKIVKEELSGIFNWVLDGLERLLSQKNFTECKAAIEQLEQFRKESDTVLTFLEDGGFQKTTNDFTSLADLYNQYRQYCKNYGYHYCSNKTFSARLRNNGYVIERNKHGMIVFAKNFVL